MNGNTELLNFVFQNSQMGVDTIKQLLDIVKAKIHRGIQVQRNGRCGRITTKNEKGTLLN